MKSTSTRDYDKSNVKSVECKFVQHFKAVTQKDIENYEKRFSLGKMKKNPNIPSKPRNDIHVVKEHIYFKDGTSMPNLRVIENYEKPFWVTKEHLQRHKNKKESEELKNLNMFKSTESNIGSEVAKKLGSMFAGVKTEREVRKSPYVYGLDIASSAYLKRAYDKKYGEFNPFSLCTIDIEEYMPERDVTIITIAMKDKLFSCVLEKYLPKVSNISKRLSEIYKKHVPPTDLTKNIRKECIFCKTEMEMVRRVFAKIHEWMPDILEVWNIGYDIPRIVEICEQNKVNPKDIFSDPNIPKEFRYFNYKEGAKSKLTEAGVFKPKDFHELWNVVQTPSSFYVIDGMSAFYYIRQGSKKLPTGYGLDSVLKTILGDNFVKLKFKDGKAEKLVRLALHNYMTENRFLEYTVYNWYDNLGPLMLDEKTKDLQTTLPMLSGYSSFEDFHSNPKKIVTAMHFFCLERGMVLGSRPSVTEEEESLGLGSWIVTLASHRIKMNGMNCVIEGKNIKTLIRGNTLDSDQVSGYPSDGQSANVSKETTTKEILEVGKIDELTFKTQNINLFFGKVNNLEYANKMFNAPTAYEMLDYVEKYKKENVA